jgi:hypothetical protein
MLKHILEMKIAINIKQNYSKLEIRVVYLTRYIAPNLRFTVVSVDFFRGGTFFLCIGFYTQNVYYPVPEV